MVQVPFRSRKARETEVLKFRDRRSWMSRFKQKAALFFLHLSVLLRLSMDWLMLTCIEKPIFSLSALKVFQKHPHRYTLKYTMLYQFSGHLLTHSSWCIKLTITTINQLELYRTFYLTTAEHAFFTDTHGAFTREKHILV